MGEAKRKRDFLRSSGLPCIFCGGRRPATTEEHCPPRALFRGRHWPEGFAFPACEECNGGTSNDDLWVAFLAHLSGGPEHFKQGRGLMLQLKRQDPASLHQMFNMSGAQSKSMARRIGLTREPGQTYRELGLVRVTDAAHRAVGSLAAKLSKAMYHRGTGHVFPRDGGIMFNWFTNAQMMEHGFISALEAMKSIAAMQQPVVRNQQDLADQFDCRHSADAAGRLHALQVTFGTVFGFLSVFSPDAGRLEGLVAEIEEKMGTDRRPFVFVNSNDPARLGRM